MPDAPGEATREGAGAGPAPRPDGPLPAGHRYRCEACGNVTRFDVVETVRARRFHHFDLGGDGAVEDEEVLGHHVESVTCRWCGRDDAVVVEPAPGAGRP